ncbi:Ribonuclease [Armadillidium nasatum]|uniref:Ribonuclease n=1 Tax=Armadillidium nasatum TaxID=96803 RepID=A0A5N5TI80_9CRUS|nr:Ribonuclease [Armadillidium nasatum]
MIFNFTIVVSLVLVNHVQERCYVISASRITPDGDHKENISEFNEKIFRRPEKMNRLFMCFFPGFFLVFSTGYLTAIISEWQIPINHVEYFLEETKNFVVDQPSFNELEEVAIASTDLVLINYYLQRESKIIRKVISTSRAPAAIGPYRFICQKFFIANNFSPGSQAVQAGNLLFISGQLGLDPKTTTLVPGGVVPETEQALNNMQSILDEAGCTFFGVLSSKSSLPSCSFAKGWKSRNRGNRNSG